MNRVTLTLNSMISDLIYTNKSLLQELKHNQLNIVINGHWTKTDIKNALIRLMPEIQITSTQVMVIRKYQSSKASGHYSFKLGSNRSALKGNKRFIIGVKDIQPLLDYFNNKGI